MATSKPNGHPPNRDPNFYASFTRFEIELEFVQTLSNPDYIHYLAANKYFESDQFVAYLEYLQYWRKAEYVKFLQFPGPTLRALELLQEERFRRDMLAPGVKEELKREMYAAATEG